MDEYGCADRSAPVSSARRRCSVDHLGTPLYSYRYDKLTGCTVSAPLAICSHCDKFAAPDHAAPGETLRVLLWWTATQTPPLDYSVSVFVLNSDGALVAQHDGPPLDGAAPTSTWQPGQLEVDVHRVSLPDGLPAGTYQLGVKVYWYGDQVPLPAVRVEASDTPNSADYVVLQTLTVP